jgi:hypothetical protein
MKHEENRRCDYITPNVRAEKKALTSTGTMQTCRTKRKNVQKDQDKVGPCLLNDEES